MNQLYAYVEEAEQFYAVLDAPCVRRVYLDSNALSEVPADGCIRKAKERGKEIYLALPHIFRSNTRRLYETEYRDIIDASWDPEYGELRLPERTALSGKHCDGL